MSKHSRNLLFHPNWASISVELARSDFFCYAGGRRVADVPLSLFRLSAAASARWAEQCWNSSLFISHFLSACWAVWGVDCPTFCTVLIVKSLSLWAFGSAGSRRRMSGVEKICRFSWRSSFYILSEQRTSERLRHKNRRLDIQWRDWKQFRQN